MRDTNKSSTVLKAFQVLETVAAQSQPLGAGDLARAAGLERVTTYRMLRTLEETGYVEIDPATKGYRISPRILTLARPVFAEGPERQRVVELLQSISARTGETCHYSELSGVETVLTQRAKGIQLVAVDFAIGTRCELHATSVGKAILAHQTEEFIRDYMSLDLKAYTQRTLTEADQLRAELADIRQKGTAFDMEELSEGMNCVAVPVTGTLGHVEAGVSISGPSNRLTPERLAVLSDIMREEVTKLRL